MIRILKIFYIIVETGNDPIDRKILSYKQLKFLNEASHFRRILYLIYCYKKSLSFFVKFCKYLFESSINITGGTWYINSDGDGIDSNNNINISGGQTEVFGSTNGGNAALDYDNKAYLTGGTLLAVGNVGMGQTVSSGLSIVFNNDFHLSSFSYDLLIEKK